jgi:hypothetical protein
VFLFTIDIRLLTLYSCTVISTIVIRQSPLLLFELIEFPTFLSRLIG